MEQRLSTWKGQRPLTVVGMSGTHSEQAYQQGHCDQGDWHQKSQRDVTDILRQDVDMTWRTGVKLHAHDVNRRNDNQPH